MSHWGTEQVAREEHQLAAPTQTPGQGYSDVGEPGAQIHVHISLRVMHWGSGTELPAFWGLAWLLCTCSWEARWKDWARGHCFCPEAAQGSGFLCLIFITVLFLIPYSMVPLFSFLFFLKTILLYGLGRHKTFYPSISECSVTDGATLAKIGLL